VEDLHREDALPYAVRTGTVVYGRAYKGVRIIKHRLNVNEAAEALGISSEGVRQRIRRGTLESDKGTDGRVYVWLEGDANGGTGSERESERDTHAVVTRLENEVEWLRREVERKDTLLMTLMHRVPELEAPQPPPEARQENGEGAVGVGHHPEGNGVDRRSSWWRRVFLGDA